MAKLTDRQKINILAKWNTGVYTKTELAKAYKVDEKVIRNIVGKEEPTNSHFVEAGLMLEKAKKSELSPIESHSVNNAIKYKLEKDYNSDNNKVKVFDATADILKGVHDLIKKGKSQKVVSGKFGSDVLDVDLQAIDYKNAIETVSEAGRVLGVIERFAPKVEVKQENNNAIQNNISVEDISRAIADGLPN